MFTLVEGRSVALNEKVEVYYNIQKGGFSIVSRDKNNPNNGKVVAYASNVTIVNAEFKVNKNKHAQILEKQRKTVYAVVRGTLASFETVDLNSYEQGYCNPYVTCGFIDWNSKQELNTAQEVTFYNKNFAYKGAN
jgi:hypothetical protein